MLLVFFIMPFYINRAGQYMSPYDPDEGPSITGWRVQRWESCLKPVVLHQIFGSPTNFGGQPPMQTVWETKVNKSIPPTDDLKSQQAASVGATSDMQPKPDSSADKMKRVTFDHFNMPSDVRTLARIVYSAHGGEIAIAFLRGGIHIFSGPTFKPVDTYQINVGSAIAAPAFSSTSCCSASVWHDTSKDCTMLKIIRVLPPAVSISQAKASSPTWERAIAERYTVYAFFLYSTCFKLYNPFLPMFVSNSSLLKLVPGDLVLVIIEQLWVDLENDVI